MSDTIAPRISLLVGRERLAVKMALVSYLDDLQKAKKKEEELGIDTDDTDAQISVAAKLLRELGWTPPAKKARPADDTGELFDGDNGT